ncbi:MAG: hypothetical protein ACE5E5_08890 [Phycisphaerae bacterium]
MSDDTVLALLDELLALEQRQLAVRLRESAVFVSRKSIDQQRVVQRLCEQADRNAELLVRTMTRLGGSPGPRVGDLATASLHFLELSSVRPALIDDLAALVKAYRIAAERVAVDPRAADVVGRILQGHQTDLDALSKAQEVDAAS